MAQFIIQAVKETSSVKMERENEARMEELKEREDLYSKANYIFTKIVIIDESNILRILIVMDF